MKSWFMEFIPTDINDIIFDSDDVKLLIMNWINNCEISGNVLFYGPGGLGKTSTMELLVLNIIKTKPDLLVCNDRSVKYIDEDVTRHLRKETVKSKHKIILIEEFDKLSPQAFSSLKDGKMEKFQHNTIFMASTNYIHRIPNEVLQRFTYKFEFSGKNIIGIYNRLKHILLTKNAKFSDNNLKDFINNNINVGIRELINRLEISFFKNSGTIDFETINTSSIIEDKIVELLMNMLNTLITFDKKDKSDVLILPTSSKLSKEYVELISLVHNNYDINYDSLFMKLYDGTNFVPYKNILFDSHKDLLNNPPHPKGCFVSCLYKLFNAAVKITR